MIRFLRRLFANHISDCDENTLHSFERHVLSHVTRMTMHNMLGLSLKSQLQCMLEFRASHISGVPDWLKRQTSRDAVVVTPQRRIGAQFGAPPIGKDVPFEFDITLEGVPCGFARFVLDQSIREIVFRFKQNLKPYPNSNDVQVDAPNMTDERSLWKSKRRELSCVSELVCEIVHAGEFTTNTIVAVPWEFSAEDICGTALCNSYSEVLRFSDGIRVNRLVLLGGYAAPHRLFTESGHDYIDIGDDDNHTYALRVTGNEMSNEVIRFSRGSSAAETCCMDVLELIKSQINA